MIQAARRLQLARPGEGTDLVTKSSEAGGTSAFFELSCQYASIVRRNDCGSNAGCRLRRRVVEEMS